MLGFFYDWIFGQKFDFLNSVIAEIWSRLDINNIRWPFYTWHKILCSQSNFKIMHFLSILNTTHNSKWLIKLRLWFTFWILRISLWKSDAMMRRLRDFYAIVPLLNILEKTIQKEFLFWAWKFKSNIFGDFHGFFVSWWEIRRLVASHYRCTWAIFRCHFRCTMFELIIISSSF